MAMKWCFNRWSWPQIRSGLHWMLINNLK